MVMAFENVTPCEAVMKEAASDDAFPQFSTTIFRTKLILSPNVIKNHCEQKTSNKKIQANFTWCFLRKKGYPGPGNEG